MPFAFYSEVEQAMQQIVQDAFYPQPFFQSLLSGSWSRRFLEYFTVQYAHYSAHFPRVLGAAISAMEPNDSWWIPLADNLWDEAGRGRQGHSHSQLYRTFALSVMSPSEFEHRLVQWPCSLAVSTAIDHFITFFHHATSLQAMAAVGLGSEFFAGDIMGLIGQGLRHPQYQRFGPLNPQFWELHADSDEPRHYHLCRNVLLTLASDRHNLQCMFTSGQDIALSEANMYRQLYCEGEAQHLLD